MKIVDPGHEYILEGIGGAEPQTVIFVKNRGEKYPGNVGDPHGGTLSQELIRVLIDRTAYLNAQGSCAETEYALAALRQALAWFEFRAARCRGDVIELPRSDCLEMVETCRTCGHTFCDRKNAHESLPGTWR